MRDFWGPVGQIGYVVSDVEAAATRWHEATGIGPWRIMEDLEIDNWVYDGTPGPMSISMGVAYSGGVQIELIEQRTDAPSMYRDLLDTYGEGAQHVCFYPPSYDEAMSHLLDQGMTVGQAGELWGIRFAYMRGDAGQVIEFAELPDQVRVGRQKGIEEAADWDGENPIRGRR